MKILLVNPNRFVTPPAPPIGLEHVAGELQRQGHEAEVLDLCFSKDPLHELSSSLSTCRPDMAGVTVRNVDTVLYQNNQFFLDEIKKCIGTIKSVSGVPVVVGGAGVSADPEGVLSYLGADHAVDGPAEDVIGEVIAGIGRGDGGQRIFRRRYRYDLTCARRQAGIDYPRYQAAGGIAGFATHTGCTSSCVYCIEASTPVSFRPPGEVIGEIRGFVDGGITKFHLCDPEFNEDADYCMEFCEGLKRSGIKIDWAVYMKPANFSKRLIRLMAASGVSLITLTVDSWKKCPLYYDDIQKIVFSARAEGIRVAVDFLTGFPYEEADVLPFYLDLFRRTRPDGVGINTYIRLYRRLRITGIILGDEDLRRRMMGATSDASMVRPVFYNHVREERLRELIGVDPLFKIEGVDKGINYVTFGSSPL